LGGLKFLHTGDTHLCHDFPPTPTHERLKAFNKAFDKVVSLAIENDVDFVLHSGDFFDKVHPWSRVVSFANRRLRKLEKENIPFYVIRGNHDGSYDRLGLVRGSAPELLTGETEAQVVFLDPRLDEELGNKEIGFRDYNDELRIIGLGYYGAGTKQYVEKYVLPAIAKEKINIVLLHTFVQGVTSVPPNQPFIPADMLAMEGVYYVAISHDHSPYPPKVIGNTVFVNPGATEYWQWNEAGKDRCCCLAEFKGGKFEAKLIKIEPSHEFDNIVISPKEPESIDWYINTIKEEEEKLGQEKKAVTRFALKGTLKEGSPSEIPASEIEKVLMQSGRFIYVAIDTSGLYESEKAASPAHQIFDLKRFLMEEGIEEEDAENAVQIYETMNSTLDEEANITSMGRLKKDAERQILSLIRETWGEE